MRTELRQTIGKEAILQDSDRPRRTIDMSRPDQGGTVRLMDYGGKHIILNQLATIIWHNIDGHRTVRDIADGTVKAVNDQQNEDALRKEVLKFLNTLVERGCIEIARPNTWDVLNSSRQSNPGERVSLRPS